jgi:hypothetical protein
MLLTVRPAIAIFGSSNPEPPEIELGENIKAYLVTKAKTVGMGTLGGQIFGQLESHSPFSVDRIKGIDTSDVSLALPLDSEMLLELRATDFPVFASGGTSDDSSAWAIYDRGDLGRLGFRGIARHPTTGAPCSGDLWPVVLRGNQLYWGFATDSSNLTSNGRHLFANLIAHLKRAPLGQPAAFGAFPGTGDHLDRSLTCDVPENEYRVYPTQTGSLDISLKAVSNLLLTITGPNNHPVVEREAKNLNPPLSQRITSVTYGDSWRITVSYRTPPGKALKKVRYNLRIEFHPDGPVPYPDFVARSPVSPLTAAWALAWLAVVALIWTGRLQSLWSRRPRFMGWLNRKR